MGLRLSGFALGELKPLVLLSLVPGLAELDELYLELGLVLSVEEEPDPEEYFPDPPLIKPPLGFELEPPLDPALGFELEPLLYLPDEEPPELGRDDPPPLL